MPDTEADDLGGADVASGDARGEAEGGVIDQDVGGDGGDEAEHQAPMHVGAGNGADHVGGADLARRRLVEARRIAHRPLDQMVQNRKRDIDQQQARDRLVDPAILPQAARQRDPEAAADHARDHHGDLHHDRRRALHRQRRRGRRQCADQKGAFATDDHHAELCRQRRAQRGQDQRRGAGQRVLPGEGGAERAVIHVEIQIERVLAVERDKAAEHRERADQRRGRDQDVFDARAVALEESGINGRSDAGRLHRFRRFRRHAVAPITPSTR
ncbi:hypothetical protein ACVMB1_000862 [Bradyrhizobium sp. USDA 4504]